MKVFLLVCFLAATLADQSEYEVGNNYFRNKTQAYYDYYANFTLGSGYDVSDEYSQNLWFKNKKGNKILEFVKINVTTEISDKKSPTAIPTEGGTLNKLPPNQKLMKCETTSRTAQVLDCSDQNRQIGQKGEKGEPGKDLKGVAEMPGRG